MAFLIFVLISTVFSVASSSLGVQHAQAATTHAVGAWPKWGHFHSIATPQFHTEPEQRVPILGPHVPGTTQTAESTNWSGVVDSGAQYIGLSGEWFVPTVKPSGSLEASGTWIGIDGATNTSLIQTGTGQQTSGDTTTYFAW